MAGPLHHDVRGDAEGEGVDDEGAATGMGADELPLGLDLVGATDLMPWVFSAQLPSIV